MQHSLTPYSAGITNYAWWDEAFTKEELDYLQELARRSGHPAEVGSQDGARVDESIRRSELNWLFKTEESEWVYAKLAHAISTLNADYFNFSLSGFGEAFQLTNYSSHNQGTYSWHQDFGSAGPSRKLSLVLQLSNPEDYEGGELQFLTSSEPNNVLKKRGFMSVFPAWTLHQVTPVTRGNRQTLVGWVSGEPFK